MGLRRASLLAVAVAASCSLAPVAGATTVARPPVTWMKGEGNFTKSHRPISSIDRVVVHVTEGSFWGSIQWLQNPRAHASSHYVVSRGGKIVQLVHLSDIAWHAGHWGTNAASVGIEHEGFTYGPHGFTASQYRASARLTAWLARRSLMPINRRTIIGHRDVPDGRGGRGGASHHTDPGPRWRWGHYLALVKRYAGVEKLSVTPLVPEGTLRGIVSFRAKATGGIKRVEFSIDGRVVNVDSRPPYALAAGLNTTKLSNGRHVLQVHGVAGPGRYDIARRTVVVDNKTFALTSAGARAWTKVRRPVNLRVRPWGAKAQSMTFVVDGKRRAVDMRAPFWFSWNAAKAKPGRHVLVVHAVSVDGRSASQRIPLVVPHKAKPKPKAQPTPKPKPPVFAIAGQSLAEGQEVSGLVVWRVDLDGRGARVEFLVDGVVRGTDVAAPYTFGWDTATEAVGPHRLTARAIGPTTVERTVNVTVAPRETSGSAGP